ncbi:MAG: RNA polymerase subunit sigma [Sandaracinus sp.]|nr:RNA polymerase subunit sigma [Sandaracinus sp.]
MQRQTETDPRRMREIYEAHVDDVWRTVAFLGVAKSEVPDVCQEVFLTVYRRLPSFEGRSSLRSWIYGITMRTVAAHRRRAYRRRERPHAEPPEPEPNGPDQEHRVIAKQRVEQLRMALDGLNEQQRAVFVLYEIHAMKMSEVATTLEVPIQTAYSRLHAARRAIRTLFGAEGGQ